MNAHTHTPGPWVVHHFPHGAGTLVVTNPPKDDSELFKGQIIASQTTCPNWQANARLIASAPELLQRLTELANICSYMAGDGKAHEIDWKMLTAEARAAIAKATAQADAKAKGEAK